MRKFFKILFSRMTLVIMAILLQLVVLITLPYTFLDQYSQFLQHFYLSAELVFRFFAIILLLRIINMDMNIEGKLTWSILLLILPILGIILYFLFVRRCAPVRHRKYFEHTAQQIKQYQVKYRQEDDKLKQELGDYYGQFEYVFRATGYKAYANTQVKYLSLGERFFEDLVAELKTAQKYIFMEYFIIECGKMWNTILNLLKQKVDEGVEVRVMYDDLGTINKLPHDYFKRLTKAGIKCVKFNSFVPIMSAIHNNRDHRKITVIDGHTAFVSGLNLADEYINEKHPFGHWKDTGVKLTGEAVKSLTIMFLQLYDVQNQQTEDYTKYLNYNIEQANGYVCPYGDGPSFFCPDHVAENVYLNIINQAKHYLYISTPYLIIDNKLTNAICNAARRGVDVKIVTPHVPDKKFIFALTRSSYKKLQEAGVTIMEYEKGFIHAKQVLCDDCIAVVGTINFDYRSLLHHYECGVLMYKTDCLTDIKVDFEKVFKQSLNMKNFRQNAFVRLMCAVSKVFTPML